MPITPSVIFSLGATAPPSPRARPGTIAGNARAAGATRAVFTKPRRVGPREGGGSTGMADSPEEEIEGRGTPRERPRGLQQAGGAPSSRRPDHRLSPPPRLP